MAGILSWLASSVVGELVKGIAAAVLQAIQQQQDRADKIALGQQRQMTADAVNALEIQRRMAAAAVKPHDVAAAMGRLDAGTF
jgi:hypothetical protein